MKILRGDECKQITHQFPRYKSALNFKTKTQETCNILQRLGKMIGKNTNYYVNNISQDDCPLSLSFLLSAKQLVCGS